MISFLLLEVNRPEFSKVDAAAAVTLPGVAILDALGVVVVVFVVGFFIRAGAVVAVTERSIDVSKRDVVVGSWEAAVSTTTAASFRVWKPKRMIEVLHAPPSPADGDGRLDFLLAEKSGIDRLRVRQGYRTGKVGSMN